jgi:hypothetical protein
MALMLGKLYAALRDAGANEQQAREAAEEAAGYETRLASIDTRVTVLTWMVGANVTLTVAVLAKLLLAGQTH